MPSRLLKPSIGMLFPDMKYANGNTAIINPSNQKCINLIKPNEKAVFYINLPWKYKGGSEVL